MSNLLVSSRTSLIHGSVPQDNCKTCVQDREAATNHGWCGVPYDTWNPTHTKAEPNDWKTLRGWCGVKNQSDITLHMYTANADAGVMLLVIDGTAPDGSKVHLEKHYDLTRGGNWFKVRLTKSFSDIEQKEIYKLQIAPYSPSYWETHLPSDKQTHKSARALSQLSNRA